MAVARRLAPVALAGLAILASVAAPGPIGSRGAAEAAPARAAAAPARINGTGSTYVALAMQQWTAEAQSQGLGVNYTPTGSPDGLSRYRGGQVDFAGTEAEFKSLQVGSDVSRGYQYVPDVAGAIAVMYNVEDTAGRKVTYLHLSRDTIARIFTGDITRWSDPAITNDNKSPRLPNGLKLPDQPINVVYRSGQSGTTALFYDFVAETNRGRFNAWAARNGLPTGTRIVQLDSSPNFAPRTQALSGSDQIAQFVAGGQGKWSIAYDEFGYAKTYGATSAWVQNASGKFVLPYAENISAALESARLREDLSQELSGVYASPNPKAYPISAYSYLVTQCAPDAARGTCTGAYSNAGVAETLARWLRYIACDGQIQMARIGYSPLPANLSQEIANSVARMQGTRAEQLSAANCANPRFRGSLGAGSSSPEDPLFAGGPVVSVDVDVDVDTRPGNGSGTEGTGNGTNNGATDSSAETGADGTGDGEGSEATSGGASELAAGRLGASQAVGGGSGSWRPAAPSAYRRGGRIADTRWPLAATLALIAIPPMLAMGWRRVRRRAPG